MEQTTRERHLLGFGLRLTFAVFMIAIAVVCLILGIVFSAGGLDNSPVLIIFFGIGILGAILAALSIVGTVKGRTCKWGNNLVIGISAIFCLALFGIFGTVGGVRGNKVLNNPQLDEKKKKAPGFALRLLFGILLLIAGLILMSFVLLPSFDRFLRPIFLVVSLSCLAIGIIEIVCASVGRKREWANIFSIAVGAVFSVAAIGLFALFGGLLGREPFTQSKAELNAQKNIHRSTADVPLKIISIPDKEWKEYRNQAPQDELLVLGIGMKLWLEKTRKSALFFMLGLLLSVIVGIILAVFVNAVAGILILAAGYLVFCTLIMRRHFIKTSLNQAKSKLSAENKKALDAEFKTSGGATVAEVFITVMLCSVCQPYSMVLAVASAALPSLLNTKLVIPEGYGFEALEEVKSYYAEKSFLSEVIGDITDYNINDSRRTRLNEEAASSPADDYYKKDKYTYTDGNGYEQTVYSDNGKDFYDEGGNYEFGGERQGDNIVIKKDKPDGND